VGVAPPGEAGLLLDGSWGTGTTGAAGIFPKTSVKAAGGAGTTGAAGRVTPTLGPAGRAFAIPVKKVLIFGRLGD
jgi:hypothetical protein